jgi:hypothetical protein
MRVVALVIAGMGCSSKVDWSRKDSWRHCKAAIADYRGGAAPPCSALHMCANEAPLSDAEHAKLEEMVARSKCEPL